MSLYPDRPAARVRAIALDFLLLSMLVGCWIVGFLVHDTVMELDVLGRGVERSGIQLGDGFDEAGRAVDGVPVVGNDLQRALGGAGERASDPVVRAGRRGSAAISELADVLGWITGGVPAAVVLLAFVPVRVRRARSIVAARRVFASSGSPQEQQYLAMRAAFSLPYVSLLRYTSDPMGDLAAGKLKPLLDALAQEHGIRIPGTAAHKL